MLAFSATIERPALESLKISVPFSIVSRPSDRGRGEAGLGAAGLASATDGANSQFGLPSALISRTILGSTSVTSSTASWPTSKASTDGRTVIDFTSTMFGFFAPGMLKNFTPLTVALGSGSRLNEAGPSITRSRPVAFFTSARICGLYLLRSKKEGAIKSATISTPTTPAAAIRSLLRLEEVIGFSLDRLDRRLAHRGAARHREIRSEPVAEIVNLKQVRKDKARREREREAETNRQRFGRTKAQKSADKDAAKRERREHDDKKLD